MPIAKHNVSRQRSTSYAITINGLLTHRARLMRAGRKQERPADLVLADIAAIDHVLTHVIGYTGDIASATRDFKREAIFKRGAMFAAVCEGLRQSERPLTTREIATIVYATKGKVMRPGREGKEWVCRVRHACKRLERDGAVWKGAGGFSAAFMIQCFEAIGETEIRL